MAIEKVYLSEGVSQSVFDAHTHNYRKITRVGVDIKKDWPAPTWVDIVEDSDSHASGNTDIEAAGVTVATQPTSVPV